jgi:hypothetical protein
MTPANSGRNGRKLSFKLLFRLIQISTTVLCIYLFSIGPAYHFYARGGLNQSGFLAVYEPLLKVRDRSPAWIASIFDSYMRFWFDYRPRSPAKAKDDTTK